MIPAVTTAKPTLSKKLMTWRDGASVESSSLPATKNWRVHPPRVSEALQLDEVQPIPRLIANKKLSDDLIRFKDTVRALSATDTLTLIVRLATTADPLVLWAIHCNLDKREIAPALRWPANNEGPQFEFINYAADLLWFSKRNPNHQPAYRGWRGVFTNSPASQGWHATVYRQYIYLYSRYVAEIPLISALADAYRYVEILAVFEDSLLKTIYGVNVQFSDSENATTKILRNARTFHAPVLAAITEAISVVESALAAVTHDLQNP